jgi:ferrous iron transport protein B
MSVLAELENEESAIISKVKGYGAFRKRINEMGFIVGTKVTAIKKAPLQDPVEYELLGYRVTLRKDEAQKIEIVSEKDKIEIDDSPFDGIITEDLLKTIVRERSKTIQVALIGNPNCGKTTLFNFATGKHERVGNYGGVTVDMKTAKLKQNGYTFQITDLPGTYSISEYSPEELFVRKHLFESMPDVVINVIDSSNLERNLYLTTQLIDMNIHVVAALNMYDELEQKGDNFDYVTLGKMIGIPFVPTVASRGKGITELLDKVIEVYENREPSIRHIHINYGQSINNAIDKIKVEIKKHTKVSDLYHAQYVAVKLLEHDSTFEKELQAILQTEEILERAIKERNKLEKEFNERSDSIITDAKYSFIRGALKQTYTYSLDKTRSAFNHGLDVLFTHTWLGFPVFVFFMWAMFQLTFSLGSYPMHWIDSAVSAFGIFLKETMSQGMLRDLVVDGIIGGVGGVIIFLPNIVILFFCISLMEDTGYMARAAFIMDRIMRKIGLHGKSFIPLLMGFGCNVPAVMATRTLDNRKDRVLTMLIIPFMSCSARLPVYVLLISAFFPASQGFFLLLIYAIGVILSVVVALLFKRIFFKKEEVPFVMELPPYRIPTLRNTLNHMWGKSVQYLQKMGNVILVASILIWAMGYFPREVNFSKDYKTEISQISNNMQLKKNEKEKQVRKLTLARESERLEKSYIGKMGHFITPVIQPLGFDWKIGVSIVTGLAAKEIVVSTMGVLYQSDFDSKDSSVSLQQKLKEQTHVSGPEKGQKVFNPLVAFSLMLFVLIYFPCVAVIAAIKRESNWKWATFTLVYTTVLAWVLAFGVYQIGSLF